MAPILVVASTNRPSALSHAVATHYAAQLRKEGHEATLLSLTDLPADFTRSALYAKRGSNPAFNALAHQVVRAHKMVFVVPQYHGSFPGVLKAFIDGLPYKEAFIGKRCALVGVSQGYQGCLMGLRHLTDIFHYLGMAVYPFQPHLAGVQEPTLEAVAAHPKGYLALLERQYKGFLTF